MTQLELAAELAELDTLLADDPELLAACKELRRLQVAVAPWLPWLAAVDASHDGDPAGSNRAPLPDNTPLRLYAGEVAEPGEPSLGGVRAMVRAMEGGTP